jgi:hypothetical protein
MIAARRCADTQRAPFSDPTVLPNTGECRPGSLEGRPGRTGEGGRSLGGASVVVNRKANEHRPARQVSLRHRARALDCCDNYRNMGLSGLILVPEIIDKVRRRCRKLYTIWLLFCHKASSDCFALSEDQKGYRRNMTGNRGTLWRLQKYLARARNDRLGSIKHRTARMMRCAPFRR